MPIFVIAAVALFAVAGLAIDSSHAYVNKTRLQNMSDASALAAAKVYDQTVNVGQGTAAANSVFGINSDGAGNFEIDAEYDAGNISVVVQWSTTLNPFIPSGVGPYVRVIATGLNVPTTFSAVLGRPTLPVIASAVAGPSPAIESACNIAPIVACANDLNDQYFGFDFDKLMVLKPSPGDHADVGPGNYKMLRTECPGGACLREALAGSYEECAGTNQPVDTEPGVSAGPSIQGFNTRFGQDLGPINPGDYPPDVVTLSIDPPLDTYLDDATGEDIITWDGNIVSTADDIGQWDYDQYETWSISGPHQNPHPTGEYWRRVLALPVAECTGEDSGQSTLNVEGFACFFMLQPIEGGPEKNIYGQFTTGCISGGAAGSDPGAGPGPYLIQLYKDPDSIDS